MHNYPWERRWHRTDAFSLPFARSLTHTHTNTHTHTSEEDIITGNVLKSAFHRREKQPCAHLTRSFSSLSVAGACVFFPAASLRFRTRWEGAGGWAGAGRVVSLLSTLVLPTHAQQAEKQRAKNVLENLFYNSSQRFGTLGWRRWGAQSKRKA